MVVYLLFLPFIFIYLQTATIFGKNKPNLILILIPTYICIFFFHSLHCDISYIKICIYLWIWIYVEIIDKKPWLQKMSCDMAAYFYTQGVGTGEAGVRIWKCKNISKLAKSGTPKTRFSEPQFSEMLQLMNSLQLPFSYFTLYPDSI